MSDSKFGLVSNEDKLALDYGKILPPERRAVIMDGSLDLGARLMFVYLLDCSVWTGHNVRPGVVRFSDSELAAKFNCSDETIRRWKRQLRERGKLWTVDRWMKNTWPKTEYRFTVICGQQGLPFGNDDEGGDHVTDETEQLSNRRRRMGPLERDGFGQFFSSTPHCGSCKKGRLFGLGPGEVLGCDFCKHPTRKTPKRAETHKTPANTTPNDVPLPPSAVMGDRPQRSQATAHNGNGKPPTAVNGDHPRRKDSPLVGGNELPPTPVIDNRRRRSDVTVNSESQIGDLDRPKREGEGTPAGNAFEKWIKTLDGMFPSQLQKVRAELELELRKAQSATAKKALREKLALVRERIFGPAVPDEPQPDKPKAPTIDVEAIATRQPTAEEIAEGARYQAEREERNKARAVAI